LRSSEIADLGVSVEEVRPETLEVHIEGLQEITMAISPDSLVPPDIQLAAPPRIDPASATLLLPVSVIPSIADLKLEAPIPLNVLNDLSENVPHDVALTLRLPQVLRDQLRNNTPVNIAPAKVKASITIRKKTETVKLTTLPILVLAPWSELNKAIIQIGDDQRVLNEDVILSGPRDAIDSISKGDTKVWAELQLTAEELGSGITSKQLHIRVPPGVTVDSPIPQVGFSISPNLQTAPPPAPPLPPALPPTPAPINPP
jgi:hypothetical protein